MIKKADIVLFIIILILGLGASYWCVVNDEKGTDVVVTVDGQLYGTYDLNEDREIIVSQNSHNNKIIIKGGQVSMAFSDCHNQDCVNHNPISTTNQSITCLPNRVMVTIEGIGKEGDYDVISN